MSFFLDLHVPGFAATLGRADMSVPRDEALTPSRAVVDAVDLPVSADLENGFALDAPGVARARSRRCPAGGSFVLTAR